MAGRTVGKIARRILRKYAENDAERSVTKEDLKRLERDLQRGNSDLLKRQSQPTTAQSVGRAIRMGVRGFSNINKSLSHSYDRRRPMIAQLPKRREDMGIVSNVHLALDELKAPNLVNRDISGRKVKK